MIPSERTPSMMLQDIARATRRAGQRRSMGRWPAWERTPLPNGVPGAAPGSWSAQMREVYANRLFAVLVRPLADGWQHAMITMMPGTDPPLWAEKQRIKDTIFGARWAMEYFPPRRDLIDGADSYHLWVMPAGERPAFTLDDHQPLTTTENPKP